MRDTPVILDSDVAELYGVETKRINEAVSNNPDKFPTGYIIRLEKTEWDGLKSKFSTSIKGGKTKIPFAFTVDGHSFHYEAGSTLRSGRLEIAVSESSKGYVEIVYSNARSHRVPSHHYRTFLEENRRLALDDREHIHALEKAEAQDKNYHPDLPNKKLLQLTKDYLVYALAALTAGYALGRSEKYLRSMLLDPLVKATIKRYEYRKIHEVTPLPVLPAFVLLGLDPRDFERFADQLKASGLQTDIITLENDYEPRPAKITLTNSAA